MSDEKKRLSRSRAGTGIRRVLGAALTLVSIVGLLLSVVALAYVPRFIHQSEATLTDTIDLSVSALETSSETLTIAVDMLGEAATTLTAVGEASDDIQATLEASDGALESVHDLLDEDLPEIMETTRQSLDGAQQGAEIIEAMLYSLNSVSILTGLTYEPETSLAESIIDIGDSMNDLPDTYGQMAESLGDTQTELATLNNQLGTLGDSIAEIEASLLEAQSVIGDYGEIVDELIDNLSEIQASLPRSLRRAQWLTTFIFVWLGLSQIGLAFQGWEMLTDDQRGIEKRIAALEAAVASQADEESESGEAEKG